MQTNLINYQASDIETPSGSSERHHAVTGRGEVPGMEFMLLKRSNRAYIYDVLETSGKKGYDMFARKIDSRDGKIAYHTSNAFSIWAWSGPTLEKANEYFNRINSQQLNNKK